jgi:hypothetical protein
MKIWRMTLLGLTVLSLGCSPAPEIDAEIEEDFDPGPIADGKADFAWGSGATAGSASLTVQFERYRSITIGTVPVGRKDVTIKVQTSADVDLRMWDADGTKVVYKTYGKLKGAGEASIAYKGLTITWSGYNGDGTSTGKGRESIKIVGTTANAFTVKLYTRAAGEATISYSWAGTGGTTTSGFPQRLAAFKAKYGSAVAVATKQGKPAIFLDTDGITTEAKAGELVTDIYDMIGTYTIMIWNPAGENFFHLALPDNPNLDSTFRKKSFTVYEHMRIWGNELGSFDSYSYDDEGEEDYLSDYVYSYPGSYDSYQLEAERTVALIVLTATEFVALNNYLKAIVDDFPATLGDVEYNGGVPPYFSQDPAETHNCTSWFTSFLSYKVSSSFDIHANPASMMKDYTGGWGGQLAAEYRGLLVFNYSGTRPADGATIPAGFTFDFGH